MHNQIQLEEKIQFSEENFGSFAAKDRQETTQNEN